MERWLGLLHASVNIDIDGESLNAEISAASSSTKDPPLSIEAKQQAIDLLVQLLKEIENVPIKVTDMRILRSAVTDFLKVHQLGSEKDIVRPLLYRFSLDYLPGVSRLDLDKFSRNTSTKSISEEKIPLSLSISPIPSQAKSVDAVQDDNKVYMLCSIRRQQQALWTIFKFYLDGTRDFGADGQLSLPSMQDPPVFLLGTKMGKGSNVSCSVWKNSDAKQWKDKTSIAKISRSNGVYYGIPQPAGNPGSPFTSPSESEGDLNSSSKMFGIPPSAIESGPIAVSVQRRGLEKLLYLTAALPRFDSAKPAAAAPAQFSEQVLEEAVRSLDAESLQERGLVLLRARPPRRIPTAPHSSATSSSSGAAGGGLVVAFGKETRTKTVSRKNVVMDLAQTRDWTADGAERLPVIQVGKVADDHFAVDFYGLSPLQVRPLSLFMNAKYLLYACV